MKKGKDFEADYFNREDAISKHRLSQENKKQHKKELDEKLKALHYMKCPKCGHDLQTKRIGYIDIDQCTSCGTIALEPENVEKFVKEETSILKTLIDFFK